MSKHRRIFGLTVLLLISVLEPQPYHEVYSKNSSINPSIQYKNNFFSSDEFDALFEQHSKTVILVKDDFSRSGSTPFSGVLGFSQNSNPRRPQAGTLSGSSPSGSKKPPGGGDNGAGQPNNINNKAIEQKPKIGASESKTQLGFFSDGRTKKQKELAKIREQIKESLEEEKDINELRSKKGLGPLIIIKMANGDRWAAEHSQLRDKFHHASELGVSLPPTITENQMSYYARNENYKERLEAFRDQDRLPESYVEDFGRKLRQHMFDPNTREFKGTLGANRAKKRNDESFVNNGVYFYNPKTGVQAFFDEKRKFGTTYRLGGKKAENFLNKKNLQ